jgi:cytochrome c oxidase subunit II
MSMMKGGTRLAGLAALLASGAASAATYDPGHWNMPVGVTEMSRTVFDLHMLIFWVCCGIAVIVFGAMFYSVFAHRRSRHPKPADFHESTSVEIIWTIIPFAILILMAIPAAGTLIKMEDMRGAQLAVKVTGYQWKWQYEYLDQGVAFFSTLHADSNHARQLGSGVDPNTIENYLLEVDNRLVVPTNTKIRFLITANDVIHAWWVPDFAVKKDAVPGFVNEVWAIIETPGVYRGVCAELCGRDQAEGLRAVARRDESGAADRDRARPAAEAGGRDGHAGAGGSASPGRHARVAAGTAEAHGRTRVRRRAAEWRVRLQHAVRRLPPADGPGHAAELPGAGGQQGREWRARGPHPADPQGQEPDAAVPAPVRRGPGRGDQLRAHVLGQQGRARFGRAGPGAAREMTRVARHPERSEGSF